MKALVLSSILLLAACSASFPVADEPVHATTPATARPAGALLLVSLDDGQLVMQHVDLDAEFCMKSNDDPATRCFSRGEAIYDPATDTIVAYQLEARELDLYAK